MTLSLLTLLVLLAVAQNFVTEAHAQAFSFGAAGDYANGSNFQATATQVGLQNPTFHIALGDLAYSTVEQSWCNAFKSKFNNVLLISGNHDSGESAAGNINTYVQYCPYTLTSPLTGTYGKQYYFDYPATNPIARFILISAGLGGSFIGMDTNYSVSHQGYTFTQNAIDDARTKGIKWVIVGMHKNYISMMEKGNELGNDLIPMLVSKRVDLILQAHEHGYERSKQLSCIRTGVPDPNCFADSDASLTKGAGSVILVIGTGGQGLRSLNAADNEAQNFAKSDNTTYGFGKFDLTASQLTYNFVRSAGGTLSDNFTITDTGGSPTPTTSQPTGTPVPPTATPLPTSSPTATPTGQPATPTPSCPVLPTGVAIVTTTATITTSGNYNVWSRINPPNSTTNEYWLQIDSQCPVSVGGGTIPQNTWTWVDYKDAASTSKITTNLTAGDHIVRIVEKDQGLKVDKLILTNTACIPSGLGDNCAVQPTLTATQTPAPTAAPSPTPTQIIPQATATLTPTVQPPPPTPTHTLTPTGIAPTTTPVLTATPVPQSTEFSLDVLLHGIGNGGDNQSPGSPGNFQPLRPQRDVHITVVDSTGNVVTTGTGSMQFDGTSGKFTGTVALPVLLPVGSYTIKISSPSYLRKTAPGFISITGSNQEGPISVPTTTLVVGDSNNDNSLDILDYNMLVDCFSISAPPKFCSDLAKKQATDLNDDGSINGVDVNLFVRNVTMRTGD